jgi:hypothetical protein
MSYKMKHDEEYFNTMLEKRTDLEVYPYALNIVRVARPRATMYRGILSATFCHAEMGPRRIASGISGPQASK